MRKWWISVKNGYKNLKIKYKLFLLILFIMGVSSIFVTIGLQYASKIYDEQIYQKSSQVLMMSSNSIEEKLQKVEEVSFNIISNADIQKDLIHLKGEVNNFEIYETQTKIWDHLTPYISSEKHIQSISLFDANGNEFVTGASPNLIPALQKERIIEHAVKLKGSLYWMDLEGSNRYLTAVRQIRSYQNLALNHLGTLMIRMDLEGIVSSLPQVNKEEVGTILISNEEKIFFSENPIDGMESLNTLPTLKQGYFIKEIAGKKYFITHIKSPYQGWVYWNLIPYDVMFMKITAVKSFLTLILIALFITVIFFILNLANRITSPIEELVSAMQDVQKGNFEIAASLNPKLIYMDEVGILYRNFRVMMEKINELIQENYAKQLLLKETEFKALQAQINPHFLYNTLESINWLAKANQQPQISKMVESLAFLLRHSISFKEDVITVEKELEIVLNYLTIQKYRFEERLHFQVNIPPELENCSIPKLTLQPLVENAIQHALEPSIETCMLKIEAYRQEDGIYLMVSDNGEGMDPVLVENVIKGNIKTRGNGIGLKNINERIKLTFGEKYGLKIESTLGKGTNVVVFLPYQKRCDEHVQSIISG